MTEERSSSPSAWQNLEENLPSFCNGDEYSSAIMPGMSPSRPTGGGQLVSNPHQSASFNISGAAVGSSNAAVYAAVYEDEDVPAPSNAMPTEPSMNAFPSTAFDHSPYSPFQLAAHHVSFGHSAGSPSNGVGEDAGPLPPLPALGHLGVGAVEIFAQSCANLEVDPNNLARFEAARNQFHVYGGGSISNDGDPENPFGGVISPGRIAEQRQYQRDTAGLNLREPEMARDPNGYMGTLAVDFVERSKDDTVRARYGSVSASDFTGTGGLFDESEDRPSHVPFEDRLAAVRRFVVANGHAMIPQNHPEIGTWANQIRYTEGRGLTDEQKGLLEELGFVWNLHKEMWMESLSKLVEFKRLNGHTNVKPGEDRNLYKWCGGLRSEKHCGVLALWKIEKLTEIGFNWGTFDGELPSPKGGGQFFSPRELVELINAAKVTMTATQVRNMRVKILMERRAPFKKKEHMDWFFRQQAKQYAKAKEDLPEDWTEVFPKIDLIEQAKPISVEAASGTTAEAGGEKERRNEKLLQEHAQAVLYEADDDEIEVAKSQPTFKKWLKLEEGAPLKYYNRVFAKGKEGEEDRLVAALVTVKRSNERRNEAENSSAEKEAKKPRKPTPTEAAREFVANDASTEEIATARKSPTFGKWLEVKEGATLESAAYGKFVKGKEGEEDRLLRSLVKKSRSKQEQEAKKPRKSTFAEAAAEFVANDASTEEIASAKTSPTFGKWLEVKEGATLESALYGKFVKGKEGEEDRLLRSLVKRMRRDTKRRQENKRDAEKPTPVEAAHEFVANDASAEEIASARKSPTFKKWLKEEGATFKSSSYGTYEKGKDGEEDRLLVALIRTSRMNQKQRAKRKADNKSKPAKKSRSDAKQSAKKRSKKSGEKASKPNRVSPELRLPEYGIDDGSADAELVDGGKITEI